MVEANDGTIDALDGAGADYEIRQLCVIGRMAPRDEASLVLMHQLGGYSGKPHGEELGEDFVVGVQDGDWPVIGYVSPVLVLINWTHPPVSELEGRVGHVCH